MYGVFFAWLTQRNAFECHAAVQSDTVFFVFNWTVASILLGGVVQVFTLFVRKASGVGK